MKKIFFTISLLTFCLIGSVIQAQEASIMTDSISGITTLDVSEIPDPLLKPHAQTDSTTSAPMPEKYTRTKVRLSPEQVEAKFPEAVYVYPDGSKHIDYESLLSAFIVQYAQDRKKIKKLHKQVQELEAKVDKMEAYLRKQK